MSAISAQLPALQVVFPLLGAFVAALLHRGVSAWALAAAITWLMPIIAVVLLGQVLMSGPITYHFGGWPPPWGIEYRVDILSAFVLLLVSSVSAVMIPFARRSVALEIDGDKQAWFYSMYLLCLAGLLGVTITGDAFNAFVFLEISSLSSYVLIALGRDRRALLASYQYLIMGTIGATFYVIGVGLLFLITGSLNIADIASRLELVSGEQFRPAMAALAFLIVGISLKLALFPLHVWLPNAYAYAPSFATAFLAATATKVAVYLLLRFFFSVFGTGGAAVTSHIMDLLLVLSLAGIFIASVYAIYQEDVKRMLAYSSLAQVSYMTLGISFSNKNGLAGGIAHLLNHAVSKGALFLVLGAIAYRLGTVRISELGGIGRKMPLTFAAFVIAGLAIIGTPGTAGFISKWYLAVGAFDRGWWLLVFPIVASSLISVLYIGRVVETAYFRSASSVCENSRDPPLSMLIPIIVLAAASIYFGIDTRLSAGIASMAAETLLGGPK